MLWCLVYPLVDDVLRSVYMSGRAGAQALGDAQRQRAQPGQQRGGQHPGRHHVEAQQETALRALSAMAASHWRAVCCAVLCGGQRHAAEHDLALSSTPSRIVA